VHHVLGNHQADRPGGEIREATHAVERARELVARRVLEQATKLGAELVVGSNVRVSAAEVPCGRSGGCSLHDFEVDLSWFGTGIRRMPEAAVARSAERIPPLILGMMPLGRRADPGQTS
jgi:hypothetical protein